MQLINVGIEGYLIQWDDELAIKPVTHPRPLFQKLYIKTKSYTKTKEILRKQYHIFINIIKELS